MGHLLAFSGFMGKSLVCSVAHGDDQDQLFSRAHFKGGGDPGEGQPHPAGIQSQLLGVENDLFAVVAAVLLQALSLFSHQGDVVADIFEMAVASHPSAEGIGLIQDQLDVQAAFPAALVCHEPQLIPYGAFYFPIRIGAHRVALPDRLGQFHHIYSFLPRTAGRSVYKENLQTIK